MRTHTGSQGRVRLARWTAGLLTALILASAVSAPSAFAQAAGTARGGTGARIGYGPGRGGIGPRRGAAPQPPSATGDPDVPAKPEAPAETSPPQKGDPLPAEQLKALVIISGDYSEGTGFVAKMHNQFFIVTNQHVLSGNKKFTLTGVDGTKYPVNGALFGAKDYDVAILQIPESLAKHYLEIDDDPLSHAEAGSPVTVPGNADGTGVPLQVHGSLVGIGPEKVEVTAKFVHGNSGSPIIYRPTGKVIGIATEVWLTHLDDVKKAASANANHWLGFRLDNIPSSTGWVKLEWARFSEEGLKIRDMEEVTHFLLHFFDTQKIALVDNPQIKAAVDTLRDRVHKAEAKETERDMEKEAAAAFRGFIDQVHGIGVDRLQQLGAQNLYPYHANRVKDEAVLWKDLDKVVIDIDKNINSYTRNL